MKETWVGGLTEYPLGLERTEESKILPSRLLLNRYVKDIFDEFAQDLNEVRRLRNPR